VQKHLCLHLETLLVTSTRLIIVVHCHYAFFIKFNRQTSMFTCFSGHFLLFLNVNNLVIYTLQCFIGTLIVNLRIFYSLPFFKLLNTSLRSIFNFCSFNYEAKKFMVCHF